MSQASRKNKLPPFVPLFKATLKTPAWNVLSHGARSLYVLLMWQYNTKLQNHVFKSTRDAERELGSSRRYVRRWFSELEHYGFIVMVRPGGLGVEGRGKAPHWRSGAHLLLKVYRHPSPQRLVPRSLVIAIGSKIGANWFINDTQPLI